MSSSSFRARAAGVMLAAAGCGPGLDHDPLGRPATDGGHPDGGDLAACGLPAAAFCETFATTTPGGRGGDLDETRWGVARLTKAINVAQGHFNMFEVASAIDCAGTRQVTPANDLFFCRDAAGRSVLRQTLRDTDTSGFALHTLRVRQPFDFAGRTGRVVFDVDAWQRPGVWFEIWLVDEPVPTAHDTAPTMETLPRDGLGFVFRSDCAQGTGHNGLSEILVVDNQQVTGHASLAFDAHTCFATLAGRTNHLELRIGEGIVELWATDLDDADSFRRVARLSGLALPLRRGYLHFTHAVEAPVKAGGSPDSTRVWDDVAFDGPRLRASVVREIPDSLQWFAGAGVAAMTFINTGYDVRPGAQQTLAFEDVTLTGISAATLNLTAQHLSAGALLLRWNGGAWNPLPFPFAAPSTGWQTVSMPVDLHDLVPGRNQLELRVSDDQATVVANIDLALSSGDP